MSKAIWLRRITTKIVMYLKKKHEKSCVCQKDKRRKKLTKVKQILWFFLAPIKPQHAMIMIIPPTTIVPVTNLKKEE
jgi:hypothetical protein